MIEVYGVGAQTPVGLSAAGGSAAIRAGISRLSEFSFTTLEGEPFVLASAPEIPDAMPARERMATLARGALLDCLGDFTKDTLPPTRLWLILPEPRPGFTQEDEAWVRRAIASEAASLGLMLEAKMHGRGHAGLMQCLDAIDFEAEPTCAHLLLATDSYLEDETLVWLERERMLKLATTRTGFVPGEAASCILLGSRVLRTHRGFHSLARIRGFGVAFEKEGRDSDAGSLGVALSHAVRSSTAGLALPDEAADTVYCDLNGERYRTEEWAFTTMNAHAFMQTLQYETFCDCIGDVGAAFPGVALAACQASFERGYARGPRALIVAGSLSGTRGAVFIERSGTRP